MKTTEIVGRTFAYKGIGDMVYVVIVQSLVLEGDMYDSDSYVGKQIVITPNGETITQNWACTKGFFERRVNSGEYELLRYKDER